MALSIPRALALIAVAASIVLAGCGSSGSDTSAAARAAGATSRSTAPVQTTMTPAAPTTETTATATPQRPTGKRRPHPGPGAHHGQAPTAHAAPITSTAPHFAQRLSATCRLIQPPRAPQTVADLEPRTAKLAAARLSTLVGRLSALEPPPPAQASYVDLEQTYGRLADLYRFAGARRLSRNQMRAQLLPGIKATYFAASNTARVLGAAACSASSTGSH